MQIFNKKRVSRCSSRSSAANIQEVTKRLRLTDHIVASPIVAAPQKPTLCRDLLEPKFPRPPIPPKKRTRSNGPLASVSQNAALSGADTYVKSNRVSPPSTIFSERAPAFYQRSQIARTQLQKLKAKQTATHNPEKDLERVFGFDLEHDEGRLSPGLNEFRLRLTSSIARSDKTTPNGDVGQLRESEVRSGLAPSADGSKKSRGRRENLLRLTSSIARSEKSVSVPKQPLSERVYSVPKSDVKKIALELERTLTEERFCRSDATVGNLPKEVAYPDAASLSQHASDSAFVDDIIHHELAALFLSVRKIMIFEQQRAKRARTNAEQLGKKN